MEKQKILTRKELCELTGIQADTMRQNIKRTRLKEISKGNINVFDTENERWIIDYCDKNKIDYTPIFLKNEIRKDENKKSVRKREPVEKVAKVISEASKRYTLLRDEKLEEDVKLKRYQAESKRLELEKNKAKVVPTDFIIEILPAYVKSNINGIVKDGHDLIDKLVDELEGDYELKLKYKKAFKSMVNTTFEKNHKSNTLEIVKKAKDYAINRNW